VGFDGQGGAPYPWTYVPLDPPEFSILGKAFEVSRLASARVSPALASRAHLTARRHRALAHALADIDADVFVTHDYAALPMVAEAARRRSARFAYDCREYYAGQHADSRLWRFTAPPAVRAIEGRHIGSAAWVTTVSDGLADLLVKQYALPVRPTIVRSTPVLVDIETHEPADEWVALFHGHLRPDRNVHGLIDSVAQWPEHIRLEVRGNGPAAYVQQLHEKVRSLGITGRVQLLPAVPYTEVITSAARADVGIIPWPLDQPQKQISLPNKLFEYLMAGLAVVATGPSEASRLVESYGFGVGYAPASPEALAAVLGGLSRDQLLSLRAGAMSARDELCWERERDVLWSLWERLL
jgi:glycosyltransferase involved in cell wall biosynthesis